MSRTAPGGSRDARDPSHGVELRNKKLVRSGRLTSRLSGRGTRPYCWHFIVHGPLKPLVRSPVIGPASPVRPGASPGGHRVERYASVRSRLPTMMPPTDHRVTLRREATMSSEGLAGALRSSSEAKSGTRPPTRHMRVERSRPVERPGRQRRTEAGFTMSVVSAIRRTALNSETKNSFAQDV